MIKLNFEYTILFAATIAGVGTAADATPTAVLWRNGSASGVSVTVSTTAQTGLYKAVFTTGSGWSIDDFLELYVTATIAGTSGYLAKVWSSTEIGAAVLDSSVGTQITNIENAAGYTLAVLAGACADPQTSSETYAITVFGSTFTVDMAGQTSTGTRTAPTLTKS
jgi:hypothetical protein